MNAAARTIAALLFVVLLAIVLTIPLRSGKPESGPPSVAASPIPEPPPTQTKAARREPSGPLRTKRFVQRYPKDCLRPVPGPDGAGLIAVHNGRRVIVSDTNGRRTATIQPVPRNEPPLAWSPSGRYLAVGPQGLFWTAQGEQVIHINGEFQHGIVQGQSGKWSWSPISDCGVEIEDQDGRLLAADIDSRITLFGVELLGRDVESFAFSHNGRKLALLIREGRIRSLWIADLAASRMEEVRRFKRATCCVTLAGWSPDNSDLLYWAASGASIAADGWPLEGVNATGHISRYTPRTSSGGFRLANGILTNPEWVVNCGGRLLAPLGGDRFPTSGRVISFLRRNRRPHPSQFRKLR